MLVRLQGHGKLACPTPARGAGVGKRKGATLPCRTPARRVRFIIRVVASLRTEPLRARFRRRPVATCPNSACSPRLSPAPASLP